MGKLGEGRKLSNEERAALVRERLQGAKKTASNMTSLDTPEEQGLDEIAAEIGAGFVPVVGQMQGARDIVRGVRSGDPVEIGSGALGVLGLGGMTKVVKNAGKVKGLLDASSRAEKLIPSSTRDAVERAFGDNVVSTRLKGLLEKHGDPEKAVDEFMGSVYNTPKKKSEMRESFLRALREESGVAGNPSSVVRQKKVGQPKSTREAVESALGQTKNITLRGQREAAYRGFGSKEEAEAKRFKQIQKELKNEDATRVGGQREGGDVPADYYRKMYEEKGKDAVIKSAEKGEHLHKRADGSYIGAPRHIKSPQALASTRRSLDNQFDESLDAVRQAETEAGTPERIGTWYDRAKAGGASVNEPHQYDRYLEGTAAYSAGVAPETELAFNLKHQNSRAIGAPGMAYRGKVMETLDDAVDQDRPAKLAAKVGEYRSKNDARVPEVSPFGVNDFRYAQTQGYTDAQGMPWKAGVQKTMHPFMDAETALATERANMRNPSELGGEWSGAQFQELPWVYGKGQDIYGRGFKGRFKGEGGVSAALREANKTTADYFPKHTIGATYEYVPGANTGHVPEVLNMTDEGKRAYGDQGRWDVETPMASLGKLDADIGAGRRDAIYSAMGLRQLPTVEGTGVYKNTAGVVENNPVNVARVLGDFPTGDSGELNANTRKAVGAAERFRSAMDAQEAGAAHIAFTGNSRHGNTGLLLDTDAADTGFPRQASRDEMLRVQSALDEIGKKDPLLAGFSPGASPRGVAVNNYNDAWFNMPQSKVEVPWATTKNQVINKLSSKLRSYAPEGSEVRKADFDSVYEPNDFSEPFSGNVTSGVLEKFANLPEGVSQTVSNNIGESDAVRGAIRQKIARDDAFASSRPDIQNMRRFFSDANWPKAVEMIRKGATPAAAVGALGYSLNSMADEN